MSIFNFKKRADEPYELGELISGDGANCNFYRLKNEFLIGIKTYKNKDSFSPHETEISQFEKEIFISELMRKNKIDVPKIIGIVDVFDENKKCFIKVLAMEIIGDEILLKDGINLDFYNTPGKYFEISDIILGKSILELKDSDEIKKAICKTLNSLIDNLKFSKEELLDKFPYLDFQGLYSKKTKRFYLIDLVPWEVSSIINQVLRAREK